MIFLFLSPKIKKFIDVSGGTLLLSTDGKKYTKAAFLKDKNNFESALWGFSNRVCLFEEAFPSDTFVYMVEKSSTENGLRIGWLDLKTQTFYAYTAAIKTLISHTLGDNTRWGAFIRRCRAIGYATRYIPYPDVVKNPLTPSFVPDASSSQSSSVSSASTSESNTEKACNKIPAYIP